MDARLKAGPTLLMDGRPSVFTADRTLSLASNVINGQSSYIAIIASKGSILLQKYKLHSFESDFM